MSYLSSVIANEISKIYVADSGGLNIRYINDNKDIQVLLILFSQFRYSEYKGNRLGLKPLGRHANIT